jgi:hypothetical protein
MVLVEPKVESMSRKTNELSKEDLDLLRECLRAAASGPFFPEWEVHTLLGADRNQLQSLLDHWPTVLENPNSRAIVQNVLVNLTGYPIDEPNRWSEYLSGTPEDVSSLKLKFIAIDW